MTLESDHHAVQALYDRLWAAAEVTFRSGQVETDSYLNALASDDRNGLSLILRIPTPLHAPLLAVMESFRPLIPEQHFYRPGELHITVLTLIPVRQKIQLTPQLIVPYQMAIAEVCRQHHPFPLTLRGITASPSTVMAQGYAGAELNRLREALREQLGRAGLGEGVDSRYKITAAHTTFIRFRSQPPRLADFFSQLAALRAENRYVGTAQAETLDLTLNDYFMLTEKTQTLAQFRLGEPF